jgi:hypothetical protein
MAGSLEKGTTPAILPDEQAVCPWPALIEVFLPELMPAHTQSTCDLMCFS